LYIFPSQTGQYYEERNPLESLSGLGGADVRSLELLQRRNEWTLETPVNLTCLCIETEFYNEMWFLGYIVTYFDVFKAIWDNFPQGDRMKRGR
jgi:hypothetical protein